MSLFTQDVRFSFRLLSKSPGFTALAVLTLALGVTATTTILSWMNATMLDPVPGVARTSDLVSVLRGEYTTSPLPPFSYPDFIDLRSDRSSLSDMLAYHDATVFYTGGRATDRSDDGTAEDQASTGRVHVQRRLVPGVHVRGQVRSERVLERWIGLEEPPGARIVRTGPEGV